MTETTLLPPWPDGLTGCPAAGHWIAVCTETTVAVDGQQPPPSTHGPACGCAVGVVRPCCHHPAMRISPKSARAIFADLTQSADVPLDPDDLIHMVFVRRHGHVVIGDVALRCYKHKARWMYDERDVRSAGRAFAELRVDLGDAVEVQLPAYRDPVRRDPRRTGTVSTGGTSWCRGCSMRPRRKVLEEQEGRPYEEWDDARKEIG